jgi:ADP-ribose pyrophosphatase YjhB (NUDIX family)
MNTKIYFNNKFLEFTGQATQTSQNQSIRLIEKINEEKLKKIIDELLSENDSSSSKTNDFYQISAEDFNFVFDFLKKHFYYIEAAGGLIKKENKFLFIYRLNKWDLPKGKLDKNETIEHAAIRECEEECAIKKLKIEQQLSSTFHVYKYKDKYALKQTFWFYMSTTFDGKLKPQTEENIDEVKWFTKDEIKKTVFANSYFTIIDVVNEAFDERAI